MQTVRLVDIQNLNRRMRNLMDVLEKMRSPENLRKLFTSASEVIDLPAQFIEKDYWVTKFLKTLFSNEPQIIFKGGTCLSKCHSAIRRFSEDIDVSYLSKNGPMAVQPTQSERKKFKEAVKKTADDLGLEILNLDSTRSKRLFNQYRIAYPRLFQGANIGVVNLLVVETAMQTPTFPTTFAKADNYISQYFSKIGEDLRAVDLGMEPFPIRTITLERTYVDKVFAVCDYYLCGRIERNSRHIYDLCKLSSQIDKSKLPEIIEQVRGFRKKSPTCYSVQPGVDISEVLDKIVRTNFYKDDYNNVTRLLFYKGEDLPYEEAITEIEAIRDEGLFIDEDDNPGDASGIGETSESEQKYEFYR